MCGIPFVVLAARRAGNTGRKVIVATSNEKTDDALAELLAASDISCYRGSLENTLQRLVGALSDYSDDTLVFRLTGDNIFPDGALLDEIEEDFLNRGLKYLCCNGERSGLPYGMSAELTRVCYLREAVEKTQSQYDREHVTPYIRRAYGESYFERYSHLNKGHFRCTVDCLDDYFAIQYVFSGIADPERAPAFELLDRLPQAPYQPMQSKPVTKLVLGTAQLGLNYGISNQTGRPDQATAEKLIKTAVANGSAYIDTARAYGNSEYVIGNSLHSGWEGRAKIITKLSPLTDCPAEATALTVNALVDCSIYHSCAALRTQKLDVLMLHRASQIVDWAGAAWSRLLTHKVNGTLQALGVSIQSPAELKMALMEPEIEFIQMPFNVLDWRWDELIPEIKRVKMRRHLVIHVRSALLQGLLPSSTPEHWRRAKIENPEHIIGWLKDQCDEAGRKSVADFCLSFARSLDWVDGVVVGMETCEQLVENIKIFCGDNLPDQQIHNTVKSRPMLEAHSLNPALWSN